MFDKLKSLKRKKEAKIEKKDNTLIKVIIISSILGLFTMFITSNFLSFILLGLSTRREILWGHVYVTCTRRELI